MNKFAKWFVKRVIAAEVSQGPLHSKNIEGLYVMIREACEKEFTEDAKTTMDAFLQERFDEANHALDSG